jgi:hypothetical protein
MAGTEMSAPSSAAKGYAITELNDRSGVRIKVDTISATERGAKINWLVTDCGIIIYAGHTDKQIEALFQEYSMARGMKCIAIKEIIPW